MEVLCQPQPVFGSQSAAVAMVFPIGTNLSQLSVPSHMFPVSSPAPCTCYPFQTNSSPYTPSRTPTPECPRSASRESSASSPSENKFLKSVLNGQVPEPYAHFRLAGGSPSLSHVVLNEHHPSPARSPYDVSPSSSSPSSSLPPAMGASSPVLVPGTLGAQRLSVMGAASTPVLSPPPEDMQTEPMDLSCKRPASTSSVASSSSTAAFHHTLPPSPCEDHQGQFSLLRNLLQVGKNPQPSSSSSAHSSPSRDRSCNSPYSDPGTLSELSGTTLVRLSEENLYSVSARVSDWLMKIVQFATSIPCFRNGMGHQDRCILLLSSWSRLLLLFMAENNFQFSVAPLRTGCSTEVESTSHLSDDQPTMKSVEFIRCFIRKCQRLEVEPEEYHYMRMLVLFNSSNLSNRNVQEMAKVEAINNEVTSSLREHVSRTHPHCRMRYSRLLLTIPVMYSISDKMVERLFCRNMDSDSITEVGVLLKDLLNTFYSEGSSPGSQEHHPGCEPARM